MNYRIRHLTLLIFLTSLTSYSCDQIDIKVYDVGHGNCTAIIPDNIKCPALIIDCGTKFGQKKKDSIAATVIKDLEKTTSEEQKREVIVVISHPDIDHFNAFMGLADLIHQSKRLEISLVLSGGNLNDYKQNHFSFVYCLHENLLAHFQAVGDNEPLDENEKITIEYKNTETGETEIIDNGPCFTGLNLKDTFKENFHTIWDTNDENLKFLFHVGEPEASNKNLRSLIVRIEFHNYSLLIPGDTSYKVLNKLDPSYLKANTLIAPHHGSAADTMGSRRTIINVIQKISPNFIIISCNSGSNPPHQAAINIFKEDERRQVYRTNESGNISITAHSINAFQIKTEH